MWFSTKVKRAMVAVSLVFCLGFGAFADTIKLKDGSIIKGKIVIFGGGKFIVAIGEGSRRREMTFFANEVESIKFEDIVAPATTRTASYEQPNQPPRQAPPQREDEEKIGVQSEPSAKSTGPTLPVRTAGEKMKPIEWRVRVMADNTANGWTNTGWVVKKGQRIRITGNGKISLGRNRSSTPAGDPDIEDTQKLLKNVATGALIAVIGDDNNDFIYVGSEREFVATRDGALFLGINEGNLDDNSGTFDVKIEIILDGGN